MLYQLQSVLQKRTFRYYNFFNCAKHSILPDKTSPARKRARRTYSQNSIAQKSKIIVSKGSFFIQSLNKLTPEFSPTHFILRKSYIKGKKINLALFSVFGSTNQAHILIKGKLTYLLIDLKWSLNLYENCWIIQPTQSHRKLPFNLSIDNAPEKFFITATP